MEDSGSLMWLIIDVVFVAVLAGAIIWGSLQWSRARKNRALTQARDAATDRNYDRLEK